MLTFHCSSCKKKIVTEDELAGQQGECPFCKKVVVAPAKKKAAGPEIPPGQVDFPRCPKCGARRQEMKRTCGFCGADFDAPVPQQPPKTRRVPASVMAKELAPGPDRRKVVLLGLVLALGVVIAGVVFFFSGGDASAPDLAPDEACRRHLILLDFARQEYEASHHAHPASLGSQFWLDVVAERGGPARLKCPGNPGKGRVSDYRGPGKPYKDLPSDGILAATYPGDHPGGLNLLLKNGTVLLAAPDSDLHKRALAETKE
jgi:hypothetical protein